MKPFLLQELAARRYVAAEVENVAVGSAVLRWAVETLTVEQIVELSRIVAVASVRSRKATGPNVGH